MFIKRRNLSVLIVLLILVVFISSCKKTDIESKSNDNEIAVKNENNINDIEEKTEDNISYDIDPESIFEFGNQADGNWSVEKPYINPLGMEESYSTIEIVDESNYYLSFLNADSVYEDKEIYGKLWKMNIPFENEVSSDVIESYLYDLENYAKNLECEIEYRYKKTLVFHKKLDDKNYWWAMAYINSDLELEIDVIKEKVMKIGDTLVIKPADYENEIYYFTTYNEHNKFQTATFDITNGYAEVSAVNRNQYGNYIREFNFARSLDEWEQLHYVSDNLMFDSGSSIWSVEWFDDNIPEKITIKIENNGVLENVKYGEKMGAITVSAENVSDIRVSPSGKNHIFISHPLYSYQNYHFDKMPNGDYLIYVPSGYWDVSVTPAGDTNLSSYTATMVPVNAGEMTKVKVPFTLTNELKYKIGEVDQGINILTIKESNDKVNVRFSLVDKNTQVILPDLENTEVFEGTFKTKIDSINRVKSSPNIVLAIDSSGSMKGQMQKTIKSAKLFIESMQDDVNIQIIDFDSKVKMMKGSTKKEALSNLNKINVGGATVLYDTTINALESLEEAERPTIVLFTDGEDANLYDTDRGSVSDKENVIDIIKNSNIPIYSIGFGENPDKVTLGKFAEISNGKYFNALDETALNEVFKSINDRLSNTYELIYSRPKESQLCDIPVVTFVIDTSGSMTEISDDYNSLRITNVKNLFHDFIINLPDDIQMQLIEFNQDINLLQAMTIDKTKILRGISDLYAGGATEILGSVEIGYKMLKSVPSTSKVLVYLTDAALEVCEEDLDYFNLILDKIKEDNIKVLWIGMGVEDNEDAFIYASEKSDGKYIITEDPDLIRTTFDEMIKEVETEPKSDLISTKIIINKVAKTGELNNYSASVLSNLTQKKKSDIISESETIKYSFMELPKLKDSETAKLITGDSMDVTESKIIKRIKLNGVNNANDAIKLTANELVYLSKLKGLDPPSGYRFLALTMNIENIIKEQEVMVYPDGSGHPSAWVSKSSDGELKKIKIPYLIPNYTSHFYVGYNNSGTYPASAETWLAEKPISNPSNFSITIEPEKIIDGTMIFLVPDNEMDQLSLHYYDVNYGHIDIPLIGKMTVVNENVKYLPKTATGKLTDTFSMEINGFKDMNKEDFDFNIFNLENSIIRKIEANFISKMQALININPRDRVKLKINSEKGDFYIPINEITSSIPSGFISKLMISPGSFNKIYMCYQIPKILKDYDFNIFVELKDEDALIGTDVKQYKMTGDYLTSEYFKLKVNNLIKIREGNFNNCIVADITIEDIKDGYSSYGIPELFNLQSEDYDGTVENSGFSYNPELRDVYDYTNNLLLGFSENTLIFDGTNRRGFLMFYLDDESINKKWYLKSTVFKELNYLASEKDFNKDYLVEKTKFEKDDYYTEKLNDTLTKVINKYNSEHQESSEKLQLANTMIEKETVEAPSISIYGSTIFESINSVDRLKKTLKELEYIPSKNEYMPFTYKYSKEAVLTQGYGTASDLANIALRAFSKLGYSPKLKIANLTDKGKAVLKDISKVDDIKIDSVPAIIYKENNKNHTFVIPFMDEIENLRSLVYFENNVIPELKSDKIYMKIFVNAISKNENANAKISDFNDALAGEVDDGIVTIEVDLLEATINTDTLSLDAIDIAFVKNQNQINTVIMTKGENIVGDDTINLNEYDIKSVEIQFAQHNKYNRHITYLNENESLDNVFFTVSINSPDLTEKSIKKLKELANSLYDNIENPSELTALKWHNRSIINEFIANQSLNDEMLSKELDIILGRTSRERIIVVSNKVNDIFNTHIDLVDVINEMHSNNKELNNGYNIISGLFASSLESKVLKGKGMGIDEIWEDNQELVLIPPYVDENYLKEMREAKVPENLINYINDSTNYILIQEEPTTINSKKRYAWYEINPKNYEMISKIDTFENGAMVSYEVTDTAKNAANFAVGAFKGVETSIWSVSVFSLETADYKEILKKAKALALGIAKSFDNIGVDPRSLVGSELEGSYSKGGIKATFNKGGVKFSDDGLGFQNGFKAGVNYYFENAN